MVLGVENSENVKKTLKIRWVKAKVDVDGSNLVAWYDLNIRQLGLVDLVGPT